MAARWKAKPKGFATVQKTIDGQKWWVRPGQSGAPDRPTSSGGGRASTTTRSGARNSLVPREWVGSEGLIGNWAKAPRLDPTKFETIRSDETGRWWARPRTELTGLDPQTQADIRAYDQTTAAQSARIDAAYAQFVQQAGQNAQAGNESLNALTGMIGSGYSGDPTGAVLSEAARASHGASVAPIQANLSRMPTLAADAGRTANQAFTTERLNNRASMIADYRRAMAEAEEARKDRAAMLRGQELEHLGRLAGIDADMAIAELEEQGRDTRSAREENGRNRRSDRQARIDEQKIRAEEKKAAKKAGRKPPKASDIRQWAKRAREMWEGVPFTETGDDGKNVTRYRQYNQAEILRELIAMGATRPRALKIVRNIVGDPSWATPEWATRTAGSIVRPGF